MSPKYTEFLLLKQESDDIIMSEPIYNLSITHLI